MQFSLQTLMLIFVVVAAAVGLFGMGGMVVSAVVLVCAGYIRMSKDSEKAFYNVVVLCIILLPFSPCILLPLLLGNEAYQGPRVEPSQILESPVWKVFLSLTILIGTTVLIVRRPLPETDADNNEKEEEIRLEDTSEPEENAERQENDSSEDNIAE